MREKGIHSCLNYLASGAILHLTWEVMKSFDEKRRIPIELKTSGNTSNQYREWVFSRPQSIKERIRKVIARDRHGTSIISRAQNVSRYLRVGHMGRRWRYAWNSLNFLYYLLDLSTKKARDRFEIVLTVVG